MIEKSPLLQKSLGLEKVGQIISEATNTKTEKVVVEESGIIIDTVKKVVPAVVSISTSENVQDFFGQIIEQQGAGTGFILTSDGLIITNKHVVSSEGAKYTVILNDGRSFPAEIKVRDPNNDFAILKIDGKNLPVMELGDSDKLQVGQWVIAIGNALGEFENTVTTGVLSAKNRNIITAGSGFSQEQLTGLLQTDAPINPGNSGGPLVNLKGQVIGINTAVADAQSIGFAIPINSIKKSIASFQKTGKIVRPYLGVRYLTITQDIAKTANLPVDYGVLVYHGNQLGATAVANGSPADKAGIVENDIITEINGQRLDEKHPLPTVLAQFDPGQEIELTVIHKGETKKIKLTLTEYP
ncbi:MAG: Protease Do, partial [Candidatus Berkelbacteria bacterium Licking1014_2]